MSDPIIQVRGLGKRYHIGRQRRGYKTIRESVVDLIRAPFHRASSAGENDDSSFWALKDINFDIQRGEVVGIIGRNGAGKSTLLKVLSRITAPTEGEVIIDGRVGSLLEVGTGFHPELTGRENIYLNGAILGMTRGEISKKFDEIVAFAETEKFLDTQVKHYSSGMYMRLAFAVAAHLEPEILIVDEVLAVGDAEFQKKCLGKMQDVSKTGRTVLFVSHSMAAITTLCQRCVLLARGSVRCSGATPEVVAAYQSDGLENSGDVEDLSKLPRHGNQKAKFTRISVSVRGVDGHHNSAAQPVTGDDVVIDLTIAASAPLPPSNVAVIIYDPNGYRLVDVNSALNAQFLTLEAGQTGRVQLVLEDLRLKPGAYRIGLWLGRGGIEDIDNIDNARSLVIGVPLSETRHSEVFPGPYQCRSTCTITANN